MLQCPKCLSDFVVKHSFTEAGNQRYSCRSCGHRTVAPLGLNKLDSSLDNDAVKSKIAKFSKKNRFVITSAQNATPVFESGLNTLENYCSINDAELVVIPLRYRNPTSLFSDKDDDWWDRRVVPYLMDRRVELHRKLTILGDIKTQPTAVKPLTGIEGFTGTSSCIVGHPKAQMKTVPTRQGDMAKIMQTTGSITLQNYTPSKAGAKGEHHHVISALVVEIDGDKFHMRRITINKDGSFYDLDRFYSGDSVKTNQSVSALVLGDLHQWWIDEGVSQCIKEDLIPRLNPETVVMHDVIDSFSISHHHKTLTKHAKYQHNKNNILSEIRDFIDWQVSIPGEKVVVPSNHHEHILRWIEDTDWKNDPENAEFYLSTALYLIQNTTQRGEVPDPFKWWVLQYTDDLKVLEQDESFSVHDIELGLHGHVGGNGARGSLQNLSKIGVKCIVGHYHSPGEEEGALSVGTCALDMSYARGPSGWLATQAIIYPDGKRTLVHIIDGSFCA